MNSSARVLITGSSGFLGGLLAQALQKSGDTPLGLSRSGHTRPPFETGYRWDPSHGLLDPEALRNTEVIFHLAGAGIAEKRWTASRKQEILNSRVEPTRLLAEHLRKHPHRVQTIVAASATGYYGDTAESLCEENRPAGNGFLADTCAAWEKALHELALPGIRLVILRIGFVIDRTGGALPVMAKPVRFFLGAPYSNGRQYISWIDSEDLVRLFLFARNQPAMHGTFNAVAPQPVTNREFIRGLGKTLHRPVLPIGIPAFVFRLMLGEQADLVLHGQRVSCAKTLETGFQFLYPDLLSSLDHHEHNRASV